LAIGIIIGTSFQNVVKSLVDDILTPPFGLIFDGVDFSNLTIEMRNFVRKGQPPVVIRYGLFLQQVIHLLVVAFALFCVVKLYGRVQTMTARARQVAEAAEAAAVAAANQPSEPIAPIEASEEVKLLRDIRDLLAGNKTVTTSPSVVSTISETSLPNLINL
jgi:large conductance mechanosensitive channel